MSVSCCFGGGWGRGVEKSLIEVLSRMVRGDFGILQGYFGGIWVGLGGGFDRARRGRYGERKAC